MSARGALIAALAVAVTANALLFARVNPDRIVPGTDSPQYDLMAREMAAGYGLTLDAQPPIEPTLFREPGYPLLVAALYRFSDSSVELVVWVQSVLLGLAAALAAGIGTRLFGTPTGLLGGALFGLNSESAHYAHWLLTEVPFVFLLVAALTAALRAERTGNARDFVACGIGLGLASIVRVIGAPLILPLSVGLVWRRRKLLGKTALMVAAFAIVLAPWIGRNLASFGTPSISARFGINLIRRSARSAEPPSAYPGWIAASLWMAGNPLSQIVYPISRFQWGPAYEDNLIWDFHVNDMVRHTMRYEPECGPRPDPDACYAEIGLSFVRAYPVGYVVQSVFALVTLLFAPLPGPQALEHNGLVWLGVVGMILLAVGGRVSRSTALLVALLGTYIGLSIVVDTQVRYLVPMLPLFGLFAAVPISTAIQRIRGC